MNKFKKKPVIIEAVQFTDKNCKEILDWINEPLPSEDTDVVLSSSNKAYSVANNNEFLERIFIETLEGTMAANIGDYIIKGVQGEFYPCKPDIFEASYDKA